MGFYETLRKRICENKGMDWKEIWKLPLKSDGCGYAFSSDNVMALTDDLDSDDKEFDMIVELINGIETEDNKKLHNHRWTASTCDIYCDGEYRFCVRGWGHLTSPSCLGLSSEEASAVQDDFIDYILDKLNAKN